jgi:hypothetical protein
VWGVYGVWYFASGSKSAGKEMILTQKPA